MAAKGRQAIVLIHGIGQQRPMDTLRSFIKGLRDEDDFYNKPDRVSGSFELRRYTFKATNGKMTDCFELYWAHHMDKGKFLDTLRWALTLIFRRKWNWRTYVGGLILAIRVVSIILVAFLGVLLFQQLFSDSPKAVWDSWWVQSAAVLVAFQALAGWFITGYVADAARYLTPHPRNVAARNNIRSEGLELLRELHNDGKFDRVVVVGHSLGSVIGLDLLRLAWDEFRHPNPAINATDRQPVAEEFDEDAQTLLSDGPSVNDVTGFQTLQGKLWEENRSVGVPWLVTDFVTLGSPLTHAFTLLDTKSVKLQQRQVEREYPRCPPQTEKKYPRDAGPTPPQTSLYTGKYKEGDQIYSKLVAHTGAAFGPTRWSNLYFPMHTIFGDPVGGPVAPSFGPGVRDITVRLSKNRSKIYQLFLLPHTLYWAKDLPKTEPETPSSTSTKKLQNSLKKAIGMTKTSDSPTKDANSALREILATYL